MMITLPLKIKRQKLEKFEEIEKIRNLDSLLNSKEFWICSIYLFFSISLLTGVHMYEYLKCIFC